MRKLLTILASRLAAGRVGGVSDLPDLFHLRFGKTSHWGSSLGRL